MATNYEFKDPKTGKRYTVRNIKGVRTRIYANGKKVAAPKTSSSKSLTDQRFSTWDPEHQRQSLKFAANTTPEDYAKMTPAQKTAALSKVQSYSHSSTAPDSVTRSQTLNDINKAAEQAAGLKYGGAEKSLNAEIGTSPAKQQQTTDYYANFRRLLDAANTEEQNAFSSADANTVALRDSTNKVANDQTKAQTDAAAADAQARGAQVDPTLQANATQAAASRANLLNGIAAVIKGQGANALTANRGQKTATIGSELIEHNKETARNKDLLSKLRDLVTEKGQYETTTRQDLIGSERKSQMEQSVLNSQVLNSVLDAQTANTRTTTTAKTAAANRKAQDKRAASTHYGPGSPVLNTFGYTRDEWEKLSPKQKSAARKGKGGKASKDTPHSGLGSLTPEQENKVATKIRTAAARFESLRGGPIVEKDSYGNVVHKFKTDSELARYMKANGVDPLIVDIAVSLYRNKGKLGPDGTRKAQLLGVHVGKRWPRVSKTSATPAPKAPEPQFPANISPFSAGG